MVVEDSAYMRYVISELLDSDPEIEVVEKAINGEDALERMRGNLPDVITLDLQMPKLDGLQFLSEMKKSFIVPTIMISGMTREGAEETLRALELGAFDFVAKPDGTDSLTLDTISAQIVEKVKLAARIKPAILGSSNIPPKEDSRKPVEKTASSAGTCETMPPAAPRLEPRESIATRRKQKKMLPAVDIPLKKVVVIASSTGGPRALTEIIPLLPADLPACVVVVQHMPPRFTTSLAERLDKISEIRVTEASQGDKIQAGSVYIAPGDFHLKFVNDCVSLSQDPQVHGVRPSADVTITSAAKAYGERSVAVVLTGMGSDGRNGVLAVKNNSGYAIAEDESTCVVYGMPRAAADTGQLDGVFRLNDIADEIIRLVGY